MSGDREPVSKGWWQTLPGLLTAGAGIITALTGLLLALHQAGLFNHSAPTQTQSASQAAGGSPIPMEVGGGATPAATGTSASRPVTLPQMTEVRSGQAVFKLLAARVDPYSPDKVSLHLTVRMTNNGSYPANFWAASFRLSVNGTLQAPDNDLNELLPSNSSKQGDVEFVIPAATSSAGLQMGDVGDSKPTITITLPNPGR
jgi:hypothetical protein